MSSRFGVVFGAILALVLLALYCSSALYLIYEVYRSDPKALVTKEDGYIYVLTTVGGLVSALTNHLKPQIVKHCPFSDAVLECSGKLTASMILRRAIERRSLVEQRLHRPKVTVLSYNHLTEKYGTLWKASLPCARVRSNVVGTHSTASLTCFDSIISNALVKESRKQKWNAVERVPTIHGR